MVGNVWEWVDDIFEDGQYNGKDLPKQGYIVQVDNDGIPLKTEVVADSSFNNDYFWLEDEGVRGVFRGGFWGLGDRVGVYSVHAGVEPDFVGVGVGFRCVESVMR